MSYFDEVFERIKLATSIRTQTDLAEVLNIKQSSISDAKKRNSIPAEWVLKLHDTFDLNIDWVRTGKGTIYNWSDQEEADAFSESGQRELYGYLHEEPAGELPLAGGETVAVHSTFCEYRDGGTMPKFDTFCYMQVPSEFYDPGTLVFHVDSGGMEPTLIKGGYAGVSPENGPIVSGDIYALVMPHEGVVFRRVILDAENEAYLLCFEKKNFPNLRLSADSIRKKLVGKLVWVLQRV